MKSTPKKLLCCGMVISCSLVLSLFFVGCQAPQTQKDGRKTLRVVTESTATWYQDAPAVSQILQSIRNIVSYYQDTHKSTKIDLTVLPTEKSEREAALQKLRTEIMAGDGPDIYLLPTGTIFGDELSEGGRYIMEPLFPDVYRQIRSGRFFDVSDYYEKDVDLKTEELNADIMACGEMNGQRYLFPLGYTIPIFCGFSEALAPLSLESGQGIAVDKLFEVAENTKDPAVAWSLYNQYPAEQQLSFFPKLFDYENDIVNLTADEIFGYFQKQKSLAALSEGFIREGTSSMELELYLSSSSSVQFGLDDTVPMMMLGLGSAADAVGISKSQGKELSMLPVCASDGSLIAQITYFGAIDASCDDPDVAYDFLRLFLSPEVQFGLGFGEDYPTNIARVKCGWPVRTEESASAMWDAALKNAGIGGDPERTAATQSISLSDEDIPVLRSKIDEVRFPTSLDEEFRELSIAVKYRDGGYSEKTAERAANEFIMSVKYHVGES